MLHAAYSSPVNAPSIKWGCFAIIQCPTGYHFIEEVCPRLFNHVVKSVERMFGHFIVVGGVHAFIL